MTDGTLGDSVNKTPIVRLERTVPVAEECDLAVCGGGPAGCAAAIAAARAGLRVLLIEGQGQLGGTGTSGLVSHWLGGRTARGEWVVGGIFRELSVEAVRRGFALLPREEPGQKYTPHGWLMGLIHGVPFDPFMMAAHLDRLMADNGVSVRLQTTVVDVVRDPDRLTHAIVHNKSGLRAIAAKAFVDASGDADVAFRAGCPTVLGREADHLMTPATLMFHVENVDQDALAAYIHEHDQPRFRADIARWRAQGEWPFPYEIFISVQLLDKGTMMINTSRLVGVDGTDGNSVSDALSRGREETVQLLALMRKNVPGFGNARIKAVSSFLGVRETRRIVGDFMLSVADLSEGRRFADTVGLSSYEWDLPDPKQPSLQPMRERKVAKPRFTTIPYRIMLPREASNLICPGRAVSVERDVLGPLRVMAPCMAMGEAAGIAAAQVVRRGIAFAAVDTAALRDELRRRGALLEEALDQVADAP